MATVLIVIFGEILPQAVFSRHALKFGSKITWLVYFFLYLLLITQVLDRCGYAIQLIICGTESKHS